MQKTNIDVFEASFKALSSNETRWPIPVSRVDQYRKWSSQPMLLVGTADSGTNCIDYQQQLLLDWSY